jgi:hypothetical protein
MSATSTGGPDGVEELYRQLAAHRAEQAHAALISLVPEPERLFAQSANALEDAAGVLRHAAATYVKPGSAAAREMEAHAAGLVNVASRFEAAADLSRQQLG